MIFNLYGRVLVKVGEDERQIFDRERLMFTEVTELEKITGDTHLEWDRQLRLGSITAVGALLHILRKRDGQASDFATLQFNAAYPHFDVVPLHEDDSEFTKEEIEADLKKRMAEQAEAVNPPTPAAAGGAPENGSWPANSTTRPSSPSGSGSGPWSF